MPNPAEPTGQPENPDLSYEVCDALIRRTRDLLLQCEGSDDPHQARAQFDLIRNFCSELAKQIEAISDEAARETCKLQMQTVIREGRRLAPTIPYICPQCHCPWLPEKEPLSPTCPDCAADAPADGPSADEPARDEPQQRPSRQRRPRRDKILGTEPARAEEADQ